jgi:hypothetical protein
LLLLPLLLMLLLVQSHIDAFNRTSFLLMRHDDLPACSPYLPSTVCNMDGVTVPETHISGVWMRRRDPSSTS